MSSTQFKEMQISQKSSHKSRSRWSQWTVRTKMESARNPLHSGTSTASSSCLSTHNRWALNWPAKNCLKKSKIRRTRTWQANEAGQISCPLSSFHLSCHLSVSLDFINDIGPCGEVAQLPKYGCMWGQCDWKYYVLLTELWALWLPFKVEQLEQIPLEILYFDSLSLSMMMIAHAHSNNNLKNIVKWNFVESFGFILIFMFSCSAAPRWMMMTMVDDGWWWASFFLSLCVWQLQSTSCWAGRGGCWDAAADAAAASTCCRSAQSVWSIS